VLLAALGSPDVRQIDGLGGGHPLTSKVAIVEPSPDAEVDVRFTFAQVAVDRALVDYSGTCGNMSAAIGPWAILEGLVEPNEGTTRVRVLNTNTGRRYVAHVEVHDGRPVTRGSYVMDGVPRPGSPVRLEFLRPEGGATGRLLPTGHVTDWLETPDGNVEATIVDVGNPTAIVPLSDIGIDPLEATEAVRSSPELRDRLLRIRERAGILAGIVDGDGAVPAHVPKIVLVAPAGAYVVTAGREIREDEIDLRAWALTMGQLHQAYPVTAGMATAVAARMKGTTASEVASPGGAEVRIGHPSGVIAVDADVRETDGRPTVERVVVRRTARLIMTGELTLP
jgi:2-methylaconitate cis-trans-isomerase PrpF